MESFCDFSAFFWAISQFSLCSTDSYAYFSISTSASTIIATAWCFLPSFNNKLLERINFFRVSTDPGNPGNPGKTLEFKKILEILEKPWNSVKNPGKITLKSIFVDICWHLSIFDDICRYFVDWVDRICSWVDRICTVSRISGSSDPAK